MHPVLHSALEPVVLQLAGVTLDEAQIRPLPGQGRWCAQEIVEHLILTYALTADSLQKQLKTGRVRKNRRNLLESFLRVQTIGFGYMPRGIPAIRALRPISYTPESGPEIGVRFLQAAEAMDELLNLSRKRFGIETCGEHPIYGVLRVDEWRRYHALHARHHEPQLRKAIRYARAPRPELVH